MRNINIQAREDGDWMVLVRRAGSDGCVTVKICDQCPEQKSSTAPSQPDTEVPTLVSGSPATIGQHRLGLCPPPQEGVVRHQV